MKIKKNGKIISVLLMAIIFTVINSTNVFAGNFGQAVGEWFLDQLWWIGIIAIALAVIGCLVKRNWVAAVITVVAGGALLVIITQPNTLQNIGTAIANLFN
ncbi:MAG: TcpD family membrane protein [Defluviitaleaceae bacterium]|nr:TcpD family membrane protein [Defluviitaleaceae bacterium]